MKASARIFRRILLSLYVLAAASLLAYWAREGSDKNRLLATPVARLEVPELPAVAAPTSIDAALLRDQALFYASRQFFVPLDPAMVQAQQVPPPEYRMTGAMVSAGRPPIAWLAHAASGETRRVSEGDELEGWTIKLVQNNLVQIALKERIVELTLAGGSAARSAGLVAVAVARGTPSASSGVRVLGQPGLANLASTPAPALVTEARLYRPPPQ